MSRALEVSGRSEDIRHVDILTGKVVDFREMVDELSISDCLVELNSLHVVALLRLSLCEAHDVEVLVEGTSLWHEAE